MRSFVVIVALLVSSAAFAQDAPRTDVTLRLENVTRFEGWSFFEPIGPADPDYALLGNRARLGVEVDSHRLWFEGSFQYAQLVGLPDDAMGPGPLGPGALYFAAAHTPQAYQLYFKSMSVRFKEVVPNLSLQVGRMAYESGEDTPFAGRLIGSAEWTPFERSFDGVRVDYRRPAWSAHASFVMPTQGAFEESANPTIGRVQLATASVRAGRAELFAHRYRDRRAVDARPDNTGIAVESVDVDVITGGFSAVYRGAQVWAALQHGDWYGEPHRGFSLSADYGRTLLRLPWSPAIRGGALYASGDDDPNDATHGTFFPMIPTTRPDLLRGTFAQMNLRDIYVGVRLNPRPRFDFGGTVHFLSLANRLDRWYSGTGATAFDGAYFGFSSRGSTLRTALGTYLETNASVVLGNNWVLSASAGVVRGGDVVQRQFAERRMIVAAIESTVIFP